MIVSHTDIASSVAAELVAAAVAEAGRNGWNIAAAVVDRAGVPLAMLRMDEAMPPVIEFALDKAYTAATMRRSTDAFFERMSASPALAFGFQNRPRLMAWGGGLPIVHDGRVVGGIGVSGAQDHEDITCARAALSGAGLGWEP